VETDVLVVGAGVAGASAALAARDAGAEVLLAERTDEPGGNCLVSGGFLFGIDGPDAVAHVAALCFDKTPPDVIQSYVAGLAELPAWLHETTGAELGPPLPPMDSYPWLMPSWPNTPGCGPDELPALRHGSCPSAVRATPATRSRWRSRRAGRSGT
jgi:FAD binding domain